MSGAWPCLALVTLWPWDHGLIEPINRGLGLETGKAGPRSLPVALCPSHAVGGKGGTRQQEEKGRCGMRAVFTGSALTSGLLCAPRFYLSFPTHPSLIVTSYLLSIYDLQNSARVLPVLPPPLS